MVGKYCLQVLRGSVRRTYALGTTYVCVFPSALSWAFNPRSRDVRVDQNNVPPWWGGRRGLWLFLFPAEVSTAGFCELSHVRIWVAVIACRSMRRFVRAWLSPYTPDDYWDGIGLLMLYSVSTYFWIIGSEYGVRGLVWYICMWYRLTRWHIRFQSSRWTGN